MKIQNVNENLRIYALKFLALSKEAYLGKDLISHIIEI